MRTLIANGTVVYWDGTRHRASSSVDVIIDGQRIDAVEERDSDRHNRGSDGNYDRVIDATGLLVTPGLINTHVHARVQTDALWMLDRGRTDLFGSSYLASQPRQGRGRPSLTREQQKVSAAFAIGSLLRRGSTTIVEMGAIRIAIDVLTEIVGDFGIRAFLGPGFRSANYEFNPDQRLEYIWDEAAGWEGLRKATDFCQRWGGAFDGRLTPIIIPRNADTCTPDLLQESHRLASALGLRLQIHTAQTLFEFHEIKRRHGKTPVQYLYDLGILDERTILGHCVYVTGHSATATPGDVDLELLAETGTSISHSPLPFAREGRMLETFARYRRHGVNVTMATDTLPHDLVSEMRLAAYMSKVLEQDFAAATAVELFEAATVGASRALGRDDLGRIAEGAMADVVLWDLRNLRVGPHRDPIAALVHTATGDDVDTVIVDGRVVVESGLVNGLSEREILEAATVVADIEWRHEQVNDPETE